MIERNQWNNVTVFTASDFGRTTIDNGDGTDHGWGAHHFVAGGQVVGRRIYGELPAADLGSPRFTASRGRLIPSVAVEQYAATLGEWFGLNQAELATALPNLSKFPAPSLGFMQTGTGWVQVSAMSGSAAGRSGATLSLDRDHQFFEASEKW